MVIRVEENKAPKAVKMSRKLIIDIETVGEDFDSLDYTTREVLTRWIKKESNGAEEYQNALQDLKAGLGFSPLTGYVIALGVLDYELRKGTVYYQAPGLDYEDFEADGIKFRQKSERDMLESFWKGAAEYSEFITFNGRSFDIPFLLIRSAVNNVKPTKDLMSNRYVSSQRSGAKHIDLLDMLTFYGAVRRKGNLHLWCRAFGIQSPKGHGVTGDDVGRLYRDGKYLDIAHYNSGDLRATAELYRRWQEFLSF